MRFVHCSTTGAKNKTSFEIANKLVDSGIDAIELSGGAFDDNAIQKTKQLAGKLKSLLIHNYFPIPKNEFVMNLASENSIILLNSIELAKRGIDLSAEIGARYYAVHSGFLIDPLPNELGSVFTTGKLMNRESCLERFKTSLLLLADYADKKGVKLLFENNVMNKLNYDFHGKDIFLLSQPEEILDFCADVSNRAGLLLDIGHLKVTSMTFGLDISKAVNKLNYYAEGYHLSENGGYADDHDSFRIQDWPHKSLIRNDLDYYTLEFKQYNYQNVSSLIYDFNNWLN